MGQDYGSLLELVVEAKYPPEVVRKRIIDAEFPISPFAATVFLRADGDRKLIPRRVRELRDNLLPVRQALTGFQAERDVGDYRGFITIFGKALSRDSQVDVDGRVLGAVNALRETKIPVPPQLLVIKPVYEVVSSAGNVVKELASGNPIGIGVELTKTILEAAELKKSDDTGGFLEVHHNLGWTLNSWLKEGIKLADLFGDIALDQPKQLTT